jgi:hypothetical protein
MRETFKDALALYFLWTHHICEISRIQKFHLLFGSLSHPT